MFFPSRLSVSTKPYYFCHFCLIIKGIDVFFKKLCTGYKKSPLAYNFWQHHPIIFYQCLRIFRPKQHWIICIHFIYQNMILSIIPAIIRQYLSKVCQEEVFTSFNFISCTVALLPDDSRNDGTKHVSVNQVNICYSQCFAGLKLIRHWSTYIFKIFWRGK